MALRRLRPPLVVLVLALMMSTTTLVLALPTLNPAHLHHALLPSPQSLEGRAIDYTQPPALEETIEEVQKILARDPTLPRLTRGEIQELYEKVTREEFEKSMSAGDLGRADSMRALMLVLPFNTDNNTEENLQELYTRPPVTKVIETYTPPQPIKFVTADPSATPKLHHTQSADDGKLAATTYKPSYSSKIKSAQSVAPTTYHPLPPAPLLYKMQPSLGYPAVVESPASSVSASFQPVTHPPMVFDYGTAAQMGMAETSKPPAQQQQRFSSHYNAKNTNFPKKKPLKPLSASSVVSLTSTVMPVADVLETLGIVGQQQRQRHRFSSVSAEDFFAVEESAPQPVISTFVPPPQQQQQSYTPQITPDAYSSFKPLNIGEEIRVKPEVEGYLTRFGIVGGRKRKAMKKDHNKNAGNEVEHLGAQTEIATARVPGAAPPTPSELEKLLENLQELERLNVRPPQQQQAPPVTTTTSSTTTTTTTTTTPKPFTTTQANDVLTNGLPLLVEPKKPRRRIDPQLDLSFGAAGNYQSDSPASGGNDGQLAKLLENLQELERLRITPANALKPAFKPLPTTPQTPRPTIATTTTTTTTTPLPSPSTTTSAIRAQTITNRFSQFNYLPAALQIPTAAAATVTSNAAAQQQAQPDLQQLQRVLKQLQVFEQANNARTSIPTFAPIQQTTATTTTKATTTKAPNKRPAAASTAANQLNFGLADFAQLRKLLTDDRELERLYEQARARQAPSATSKATTTTTSTTTTSTTRKPLPTLDDLQQLQQYLAAFDRRGTTTTPATTTASTTPTTTTTTTTPVAALSSNTLAQRIALANLAQQKPMSISSGVAATTASVGNTELLALINRVQQLERLSNRPQTTTTTTRPPTTTTTTPAPSTTTTTTTTPTPTPAAVSVSSLPFPGFTTRNVKASANDLRVSSNDFAQLQQLYRQMGLETIDYGPVEISTARTTGTKTNLHAADALKAAEQQLIDLTNETGNGNGADGVGVGVGGVGVGDVGGGGVSFSDIAGLQAVDANDFVQLQKLLSKVQELERVKITSATGERRPTHAPQLVTAASVPAGAAVQLNGIVDASKQPLLVYAEKPQKSATTTTTAATAPATFNGFGEIDGSASGGSGIGGDFDGFDDLKLELPAYELTTARPNAHVKKDGATLVPPEPNSSEELRDLAHPANSKATTNAGGGGGGDSLALQQLFSRLTDDAERNAYKNLQPPMIVKTVPAGAPPAPAPPPPSSPVVVTKEPPRFIATRRPQDIIPAQPPASRAQADLAELQKLLSNAQELEKLGVTLPHELSQQIEQKLTLPNELQANFKRVPAVAAAAPTTTSAAPPPAVEQTSHQADTAMTSEPPEEKTVVFSVTTMKSPTMKRPALPPTAPSESALELPVISYNKVIEAAVRQAASRFGFTTEQPQGFRRRSDLSVAEGDAIISDRIDDNVDDGDDMIGEFSELNYQMAVPPEINSMAVTSDDDDGTKSTPTTVATTTPAAALPDLTLRDMSELQRLIGNLQELQRLNISLGSDVLRQADQRYLQSVQLTNKAAHGGDGGDPEAAEKKSRRQSAIEATDATTEATSPPSTTPSPPAPTSAPGIMIVTPIASVDVETSNSTTTTTTTTTTTPEPDTSSAPSAPTRLSFDLGLNADSEAAESLSRDAAAAGTTTATTTTTTTEEPQNGSLADLEASFGPDPMDTVSPPPKKKNGFYFLADWNSFLEVGDGNDQVVVRFSPKIGDPRLFLPVKVP